MTHHHDDALNRLLADGGTGDADALARFLADARATLTEGPDEVTARRHLTEVVAVAREQAHAGAVPRPATTGSRPWPRRVAHVLGMTATKFALGLGVAAAATGGLAAADSLPDPAQRVVSDAASLVGIDLPHPDDPPARTSVPDQRDGAVTPDRRSEDGGGLDADPAGPPTERPSGPPTERPSGPPTERPSGPPTERPSGPSDDVGRESPSVDAPRDGDVRQDEDVRPDDERHDGASQDDDLRQGDANRDDRSPAEPSPEDGARPDTGPRSSDEADPGSAPASADASGPGGATMATPPASGAATESSELSGDAGAESDVTGAAPGSSIGTGS